MLTDIGELCALILSMIACLISYRLIKVKVSNSQLKTVWLLVYTCMLIMFAGTIAQILLANQLGIEPVYFEYITYIGNSFLALAVFFASLIFANTKIKFRKSYLLLFIVPVISLIILWTNDFHHLFYIEYSIWPSKTIYGSYFNVYNIYTIVLLLIGMLNLIVSSVRNSKLFSKQAILIVIATLIPLTINILSTFNIVEFDIYITPISFAVTIIILTFSIFKFKFLSITPVALQRIVDRISDSYLVLNEENTITDFNKTLITTFKVKSENIRNKNIFEFVDQFGISKDQIRDALIHTKNNENTEKFDVKINKINKYFSIEINSIKQKNDYLGTLILFKDITQHKQDMETIRRNQDIIVERERLASLGQMIGGIAHNLKTPIMSIAGATEGINDLVKEYELSIDNPQVNSEDHHAIANDMKVWLEKIKSYTAYMSDVITAVKGQAVNFSENQQEVFTLSDVVKYVNILMKHELKNSIIYLNTEIECPENIEIKGNINSLVQVINNMISNAIQAYNGEPEKNIDMIIKKEENYIEISIRDYGPGLPKKVQDKLFKEMITTKGKDGTGLGLYMSYSNIRAHFKGDITFDTEEGKGTTFNIFIPLNGGE